jgi:hypothetical protein
MSVEWSRLSDDELGRALGVAFEQVTASAVTDLQPLDLATAVRTRLVGEREITAVPEPRAWRQSRWSRPVIRPGWQRAVAAVAAAVVVVAGILALSPGARRAVADLLGLRGVRIEVTPGPLPSNLGRDLNLGQRVAFAEAQRRVPFRILKPTLASVGEPDQVFVGTQFLDGQVFLVYSSRPGLRPAQETGLSLLVSEFRARPDEASLKKLSAGGTRIEFLQVNGGPGYFLSGEPHVIGYVDTDGAEIPDSSRLAGNVLLWEQGDLTLRLEGDFTRDQGVRIAGSMR